MPKKKEEKPKLPAPLFRPLHDHALVLPDADPTTVGAGLIIPESVRAQMAPGTGVVVAVGDGKRSESTGQRIPTGLSPGMRVAWNPLEGTEMSRDGMPTQLLIKAHHLCPYERESAAA